MNTTTTLLSKEAERRILSSSKHLKVQSGEIVTNKTFLQLVDDMASLQAILDEARTNLRATMEQYNVKRVDIKDRGYIGFVPYTTLVDEGATAHWLKKTVDTRKVNGYKAQHGAFPKGISAKISERFKVAIK